jgi:phage-related protein
MAKSPGGKSAGRVSIRVVPDASRFKEDLKKSLERIEKSTQLQLPLTLDTKDAELSIRKFQKKWNGEDVTLDVDAATAGASAHIAEVTRKRTAKVDVDLTKTSIAKATTLIASLSGARVTTDLVKGLSTRLQNLDRSLPKLALIVSSIGSIGAMALSSGAGILTMAGSLASLAALAAPLPGLLAAAGVAGIALIVALKDAGTQLSSLSPLWKQLQTTIQNNFWAKAKQPILDLVNGVFPQLKAGLGDVSSSLGTWAGSVASSFQKAFGGSVLTGMMSKLSQAIQNSTAGTDAFASSVAALGEFGAQYLPGIGTWFSDISTQFNGWLQQVASDGTLQGWVSSAMTVLQQLGSVIGSVVSIFGSIFSAAQAAGSSGLDTLVGALQNIATIVGSPAFQTTLTTIFTGAAAGVQGLSAALAPIGGMLGSLAPTLSTLFSGIGTTVGGALSAIAGALSQPAFANGLIALFSGLEQGITAIEPALPAVASALGTVAQFAGALAAQLGPILGAALKTLAPIVSQVLTAIQPLIPILGSILLQAIQMLSPLLQALVPIFAAIVPVIGTVLTALQPLMGAFLPVIIQLVQMLTPIIQQLAGVFGQIFTAVAPIIASILPPLMSLFQALMPIISALLGDFMALISPILQLIAPLLQLIGPILNPLIALFTTLITAVLSPIAPILKAMQPAFSAIAQVIGDVLMPVIKTITAVLKGLIDFLTGVFTGNWKKAWNGIVQIFSGIWNGIGDIVTGAINGLIDLVNGLIGSVNAITSKIGIPKIPKIPHLATGADVEPTPGGTTVVLGDGDDPETVTNRGTTNRLIELANKLAARALANGTGAHIDAPITVYTPETDGRILGRQIGAELERSLAGEV